MKLSNLSQIERYVVPISFPMYYGTQSAIKEKSGQ